PSRCIRFADRQKCPAATERPCAVLWRREMDLVTAGCEHRDCRIDVFRLEVAIKGIGEDDHFPARSLPGRCGREIVRPEIIAPPFWERPAGAELRNPLR